MLKRKFHLTKVKVNAIVEDKSRFSAEYIRRLRRQVSRYKPFTPYYLEVKDSNKKLKPTSKVKWIIWNLPCVKTCPYATEMCLKSCYAIPPEHIFPGALPYRERCLREACSPHFAENMIFTLRSELARPRKYKGAEKIYCRIHESGDFFDLQYTMDWVRIAREVPEITFIAYTKSLPFIVACGYGTKSWPKNFIVRSSLWEDTAREMVELTSKYSFPVYTADTAEGIKARKAKGERFATCRCSDCATCQMCPNKRIKKIVCEIH